MSGVDGEKVMGLIPFDGVLLLVLVVSGTRYNTTVAPRNSDRIILQVPVLVVL
jgi:hypothetical protein